MKIYLILNEKEYFCRLFFSRFSQLVASFSHCSNFLRRNTFRFCRFSWAFLWAKSRNGVHCLNVKRTKYIATIKMVWKLCKKKGKYWITHFKYLPSLALCSLHIFFSWLCVSAWGVGSNVACCFGLPATVTPKLSHVFSPAAILVVISSISTSSSWMMLNRDLDTHKKH